MTIEAKTEQGWGGRILTAVMYPRQALGVDTLEKCEAVVDDTWHGYRCSRYARSEATGPVLSGYNATVDSAPVEKRFVCTQHGRKDYLKVIVRKESA